MPDTLQKQPAREEPWLIMLIPYFGQWPEWINLFIESCKWNPGVRWSIYTDCSEPENKADNVDYVHVSFSDYKALVRKRLNVAFHPLDPYKLCDLRPCLAYLHEDDVGETPFFGYGDIDVIYGNIRNFYTEDVLARASVLSTHPERLSGHFAVFRNTREHREAFKRIPSFKLLLEAPEYVGTDEIHVAEVLRPRGLRSLSHYLRPNSFRPLFVERYSTVLSPRCWHDGSMNYPQKWYWREGRLTNELDGDREFLYLHFMRWKSTRWYSNVAGEGAWLNLDKVVHIDWRRSGLEGFCISPAGFTEITLAN